MLYCLTFTSQSVVNSIGIVAENSLPPGFFNHVTDLSTFIWAVRRWIWRQTVCVISPTYLMRSVHPLTSTLRVKKKVISILVNLHCQSRTLTLPTHHVQPYKTPTPNPHLILITPVDQSGDKTANSAFERLFLILS